MNNCEVQIEDNLLSKFQSHIAYDDEEKGWTFFDGFKSKPSTNGTWYSKLLI
jgi:hypothetical protein